MQISFSSVLLIIILHFYHLQAFRFLGLFPLPIKSHFIMYEKVLKGLVQKGHEVDVLSHFAQENAFPKLNIIDISGSIPSLENNVSVDEITKMSGFEAAWSIYRTYGADVCEKVLKHPAVSKLRRSNKKYDGIITEVFGTDCFLGFAHLYKAPMIGITSSMHLPWGDERMGNPDNPSYVANYFVPHNKNMTILQKMELAFATVMSKVGYYLFSTIPSEMRARDFFGTDLPPLDHLAFNMSLLLVNSHFAINDPRPTVPGLVEVGGLHIEKPKALPPELENLVSSAKEGVIYFSMGTVAKLETFDKQKLRSLLNVFSQLPHLVLMKGNGQELSSNVSSNIRFSEWFPQVDILCHPKVKLFITHGGQMSSQEAAYCGVPIVGIPFLAYQDLNVRKFESVEAGIRLEYSEIDETTVREAVHKILENSTYQNNARTLAKVYNDRPQSPLDTALFWIEYVVRHNGAFHLRTRGADLIWMDYYLIDVAFVFLVFFVAFIYLFVHILNFLQDYFDYSKYYSKPQNKKSEPPNSNES